MFWYLIGITVAVALTFWFLWDGVRRLDRYAARTRFPNRPTRVPQRGRYIIVAVGVLLGLAAVYGSVFLDFPALYGPVALMLLPIWNWRHKHAPMKLQWHAPTQYGLEHGEAALYLLGALATVIGILHLGP